MNNIPKSRIFWSFIIGIIIILSREIVVAVAQQVIDGDDTESEFILTENETTGEAKAEYICTEDGTDFIRYQTNDDEEDVLLTTAQSSTIYPPSNTQAGEWVNVHFDQIEGVETTGALAIYIGNDLAAAYYFPEPDDCDDEDENSYGYYGVECGGSNTVFPELAGQPFFVDGNQYQINDDGTLSWVVPEDMIWDWHAFDINGNLIVSFSQTEKGNCSVNLGD